jgi:PAS fold
MSVLPYLPQGLFWLANRYLDFLRISDASGIVKRGSAGIEPVAGYDPVEPVGRHCQNIVHAEPRVYAEQSFAGAMRGRGPDTFTLRCLARGGSWRTP